MFNVNETFAPPKRKHVHELNIVPILDMLTTIIFFLLLSTTFIQYNKLTVPPAQTVTITNPEVPPPIRARLLLARSAEGKKLLLEWTGKNPDARVKIYTDLTTDTKSIAADAKTMVSEFKTLYPNERTLEVGLGVDLHYEDLIAIMDSARDVLPDIVLISAQDAQSESERLPSEVKK